MWENSTHEVKLPKRLSGITWISRRRMAAPAAGSSKVHEVEQADIIDTDDG